MNMVTPTVKLERDAENYAKFVISPLERGYGVTLGNALRRVLLSSLDGAAITSIHIQDVSHEFSAIPGVREDVLQVMLQIKQIRLILHDVTVSHMKLEVTGDGEVTAADIQCPAEIEIVNPELYLFTVDDPKTKLEIDLTVEKGRGYLPANDRNGHLPIGELPVDAIYSPIKRVNWNVGNALYGQSTNYDKLELEIWTDGSGQGRVLEVAPGVSATGEGADEVADDFAGPGNTRLEQVRDFVGDVLDLLDKGDDAVKSIRNFGEKSLDELRAKLQEKGYLKKDKESE